MIDPATLASLFARAEMLAGQGHASEAAELFRRVLADAPGHVAAHRGLAQALRAAGEESAARDADGEAARIEADNLIAVGRAAMTYGKPEAAIASYERALAIAPELPEAVWFLGEALHGAGKRNRAIETYRRFLALRPGSAEAMHMVAALGRAPVPDRAPDRYVISHFDRYADDYDRSLLEDLSYRGPELVLDAVMALLPDARDLDIVDLGCGTGLAGVRFRRLARTLTGIDLAPAMLERARARGIYDVLVEGEIAASLAGHAQAFDLALAADVFCYLGDLAPVFAAVARALRPGGHLALTVESRRGPGWRLTGSGRYAHNPSWLRKTARSAGLSEQSGHAATLRTEYGAPVAGYVSVMRRVL